MSSRSIVWSGAVNVDTMVLNLAGSNGVLSTGSVPKIPPPKEYNKGLLTGLVNWRIGSHIMLLWEPKIIHWLTSQNRWHFGVWLLTLSCRLMPPSEASPHGYIWGCTRDWHARLGRACVCMWRACLLRQEVVKIPTVLRIETHGALWYKMPHGSWGHDIIALCICLVFASNFREARTFMWLSKGLWLLHTHT